MPRATGDVSTLISVPACRTRSRVSLFAAAGDSLNADAAEITLNILANAIKSGVDPREGRVAVLDRQVDGVNIDRQPWHVAIKEIDRGATRAKLS